MRKTGAVLEAHGELLQAYEPAPAQVGILFSPQSYYLYWAQDGTAQTALAGIQGYARALVRATSYRIVERPSGWASGAQAVGFAATVVMDDALAGALASRAAGWGGLCESRPGLRCRCLPLRKRTPCGLEPAPARQGAGS